MGILNIIGLVRGKTHLSFIEPTICFRTSAKVFSKNISFNPHTLPILGSYNCYPHITNKKLRLRGCKDLSKTTQLMRDRTGDKFCVTLGS